MNAACMGCNSSPFASPSIVVISSPSWATASVRHELMRRPFTSTVQAPHCPRSQPFFVPVRPMYSRSASSSVTRASRSRTYGLALTFRVSRCTPAPAVARSADSRSGVCAPEWGIAPKAAAAAALCMKRRLDSSIRRPQQATRPPLELAAALLHETGLARHREHAPVLVPDFGTELFRRSVIGGDAERLRFRGDVRRFDRALERRHENGSDLGRHAGGREERCPYAEQRLRIAQVGQCGNAGKIHPLTRDEKPVHRATGEMPRHGAEREDDALDM